MLRLLRHGRLVLICGVAVFAVGGGPAASARERLPVRSLLGRSYEGRAIVAIHAGDPKGTQVLVVGCIHGTECGAARSPALSNAHTRTSTLVQPGPLSHEPRSSCTA
jgi:hypothetical protein